MPHTTPNFKKSLAYREVCKQIEKLELRQEFLYSKLLNEQSFFKIGDIIEYGLKSQRRRTGRCSGLTVIGDMILPIVKPLNKDGSEHGSLRKMIIYEIESPTLKERK